MTTDRDRDLLDRVDTAIIQLGWRVLLASLADDNELDPVLQNAIPSPPEEGGPAVPEGSNNNQLDLR